MLLINEFGLCWFFFFLSLSWKESRLITGEDPKIYIIKYSKLVGKGK